MTPNNDAHRRAQAAPAARTQRAVCVVLHDVAPPTWLACQWILNALREIGPFPVTLLAVPRYHGAPRHRGFERWLGERAAAGDEVALHGYNHVDRSRLQLPADRVRGRVPTRSDPEFRTLDYTEAMKRLRTGRDWLRNLGVRPRGFVAPEWRLGQGAWRALNEQPFEYTATRRRIHVLGVDPPSSLACRAQVYSHANVLRQIASVRWNAWLAWAQRDAAQVRLELHPADDLPRVSDAWQSQLRRQAVDRRFMTLGELARDVRVGKRVTPA
jgi:predicted deacetylase